MSEVMSPGRRKALALSGSKIRPDVQHSAPDGRPVGPGATSVEGVTEHESLRTGTNAKPVSARPFPFAARK